jgi:predicted CXXCH cytochrome family protein
MTCQSCHAMHAGDPKGQLRPDLPGNRLCMQCHEQIGRDVGAHTHHAKASSGSQCVECHMPRMVYGILDIHRSHRIESPDPRRDAESARPHACTLCHADKTLSWSAAAMRRFWGDHFPDPERRLDGAPLAIPDALASLLGGDAVQRAVYAAALGRAHTVTDAGHEAELRAALLVTLGDGYPSVRWLAQRSLAALEQRRATGIGDQLARVDHTAGEQQRRKDVFTLLDAFARNARTRLPPPAPVELLGPDFRLDLPAVVKLTDLQGRNPISIGE